MGARGAAAEELSAGAATTLELFGRADALELSPGALLLRGFALPFAAALAVDLRSIAARAPFRHMVTPGGFRMSVAMTCCGDYGWVSSEEGYRYSATDPESGRAWPALPESFARLAGAAASRAGYSGFAPDACLVNRYAPGARLTLHQDRDECDFSHPIVSASLGVSAVFLWGGLRRKDRPQRVRLEHGDVVVFGGESRRRYHGVAPVAADKHPFAGAARINLTFRRAF